MVVRVAKELIHLRELIGMVGAGMFLGMIWREGVDCLDRGAISFIC